VVALGDVLEREAVGDDLAGPEVAVPDVLEQPRPLPLHRALVHPQGEALVHRVAELDGAEQRPVRAHDRHGPAFADRVDRPVQRYGGAALQLELGRRDVLEEAAVGLGSHGVDGDVEAEVVGLPSSSPRRCRRTAWKSHVSACARCGAFSSRGWQVVDRLTTRPAPI
jgi:hypothetical protein